MVVFLRQIKRSSIDFTADTQTDQEKIETTDRLSGLDRLTGRSPWTGRLRWTGCPPFHCRSFRRNDAFRILVQTSEIKVQGSHSGQSVCEGLTKVRRSCKTFKIPKYML